MDQDRAAKLFEAFFASSDPFRNLSGVGMSEIGGMDGFLGGLNGVMPSTSGARPYANPQTSTDLTSEVLPPGTTVKLTRLSNAKLVGAVGTIREFDRRKLRYTVAMSTGNSISVKPSNVQQIISDATVIGTSQAELNGRVAAAATYDAASKRYRVEGLTADGTTLALKPENVVLPESTQVTIDGVQTRPTLNGKRGRIIDVDTAASRYVVATGDEQLRLRFGTVVAAC